MNTIRNNLAAGVLLALGAAMLIPGQARAHCDGMDGPVVKAAQKALATGDVNLVLIWVQKEDESLIRKAFERTIAVRKLGDEAQETADTYFFETLVRTHRAGEGAPYTGLKPAGRDLGPAIPLADRALSTGDPDQLLTMLTGELRKGVIERFHHAMQVREYPSAALDAGREYVEAYVTFLHFVEGVYEAAHAPVAAHGPANEPVKDAHHH